MDSRPWTLLALGDSLTEGGAHDCYRPHLAARLAAAGARVEFIGPRQDADGLRHAGYSGQNAEYVAERFEAVYRAWPADIILLHAGHNHDSAEGDPVPGILGAHRSIIQAARNLNPYVFILVAQVIPAGKLPKYSYLPALNTALAELAAELNVTLVNQTEGFSWQDDTVEDLVHPNERGAVKMASIWQQALRPILAHDPPPAPAPEGRPAPPPMLAALPTSTEECGKLAERNVIYRTASGLDLRLRVFLPEDREPGELRPGVLFFHGGGWVNGASVNHTADCLLLARLGMVAASADYRLINYNADGQPGEGLRRGTNPLDCLADARAAFRWFRAHSEELGMDSTRIAAAGASAGGHLAAALHTFAGQWEEPGADTSVSCEPDALFLQCPAFELINGWRNGGEQAEKAGLDRAAFSPALHVDAPFPPTLMVFGSKDPLCNATVGEPFVDKVRAIGGDARFVELKDRVHVMFERDPQNDSWYGAFLWAMARFFREIGYTRDFPDWPRPGVEFREY
jgi:acetyl esterase/lipase